jgi:hypothetical protein
MIADAIQLVAIVAFASIGRWQMQFQSVEPSPTRAGRRDGRMPQPLAWRNATWRSMSKTG